MHQDATSLGIALRTFCRNPLFHAGLAIRILLLVFAAPMIWTEWFVPFVQAFIGAPSIDPWTDFVATGGNPLSYPYGPVLLAANALSVAIGDGMLALTGWSHAPVLGFGFSLLVADLAILLAVARLAKDWSWRILLLYWLSPLAIYICYFHGQVDVIPLAILMAGLVALGDRKPALAGTCFGLAVAAKLTFVLACPLPLIFLWRSKRRRPMLLPFFLSMAAAFLLFQAPWLLSAGVHRMTLANPNASTFFGFAIEMAPYYVIYVAPLGYALFLYSLWRLERLSFDLLIAGTGLAFLIAVLLTPATVGWYMWVVPFLALHQRAFGKSALAMTALYSFGIIAFHLVFSTGAAIQYLGLTGEAPGVAAIGGDDRLAAIFATGIVSVGGVLAFQMYRRGIRTNDFFLLSRQPVTVGIAGDSGSGKDTLSTALAGLFGEHSVVAVSGDDYHRWDREGPMWASYTHLNPEANDLANLARDVSNLRRGHAVYCHRYDHETGLFTPSELRLANDCIIVSGLHTLFFAGLAEQLDTRIYLDMDEGLRRHFKLVRDVGVRGHDRDRVLQSMESREQDSARYIRPQSEQADIVFSLRPENPEALAADNPGLPLKLALDVSMRNGVLYQDIARVLIGVCGLRLDMKTPGQDGCAEFTVEGDVEAGDLELAARMLLPAIDELLDFEPGWRDGMNGVMQFICLVQIAETLRSRAELRRVA